MKQVIPCMALIVAHLGERLRRISKKAHLTIAALSAYLNEVSFCRHYKSQGFLNFCLMLELPRFIFTAVYSLS